MVNHSLHGKTVLIAGGAKNLGRLVARDLSAHEAARIVIHYHNAADAQAAQDTVREIEQTGARGFALQADLTQPGAVATLFTEATPAPEPPTLPSTLW